MILEIDNVELNFSGKRILGGVYLKAEKGKITGILGRNGSGKSSLLQIIFGSLKPKYGLLRIDNKPFLKPLYQKGIAGFLPQHNLLPSNLKIEQAFKIFKLNWSHFVAHFEITSHLKSQRAKQLSGGERRLIEIYLILKSDYKIVVLDEPFSHLAPIHIEKITQLLKEEKENKVIIITDHVYQKIIEVSDDLYLINNGSTINIKDTDQLIIYGYVNVLD